MENNVNQNNNQPKGPTKVCKHCKSEIPKGAKVCPHCRKKQKKPILLFVIIGIILIGVIGGGGSEETSSTGTSTNTKVESKVENKVEQKEEVQEVIEYVPYNVDDMMDTLNNNALKAEKEFSDKYVEITGRLATIDSDGKYISLHPINDEWSIMGVQCYIKNDEQLNKVLDMNVGDTVTLKGKIKSIGEVMGYSLDITEIN